VQNLQEGEFLEDKGIEARILLKVILQKQDGRTQSGLNWLREKDSAGM
jgi:hypothetical protein